MSTYAKAIAVGCYAILTVITSAFADDVFDMDERAKVITVAIEQTFAIYTVYKIRNGSKSNAQSTLPSSTSGD